MRFFAAAGYGIHNTGDVVLGELVVVRHLHTFCRRIHKEGGVVGLIAFKHHDAGGYGGAKEEVAWQLNDGVDEVVVDQVLADFLFGAAAVHHAWETNDGSGAVAGEPGQRMHDECQVSFRLWRQHAGW